MKLANTLIIINNSSDVLMTSFILQKDVEPSAIMDLPL